MLKGCQHWIFLDNRSLASGRVPVFKLWLCPVVLVLWRRTGDETLVLGATGGQEFFAHVLVA